MELSKHESESRRRNSEHQHNEEAQQDLALFSDKDYISRTLALGAKGYVIKQDVASVIPALQAVMAGQTVLGAEAVANLSLGAHKNGQRKHSATTAATPTSSAREDDTVERIPQRFQSLTDRERDIVALVAEGLDSQTIARQLFLSEGTVRNHISSILAKTNLTNRIQLAVEWLTLEES